MPTPQRPKKWIYSKEETCALTVVNTHTEYLMELEDLLLREERRSGNYETNNSIQIENMQFPVLDFDRIARLHSEGDLIPSSVDIVMAVIQRNQNQPKIQLIELKLKVKNWYPKIINGILQKIEDSQIILKKYEPRDCIRTQIIVVHSNQIGQVNTSVLKRLALANNNLKFYSKSSFKKEFFNS